VDRTARRVEIANATLAAIAERGLDDVRMIDIARETEATTGQLVHYFPDKDAMLLAALDEMIARLITRIEEPADTEDFVDATSEALPLDDDSRREWRIWLQFCGRAMHNKAFGPRHERYYRQITASIATGLRQWVPASQADPLADAIVAVIDGIGVRATLEPRAWPKARQKKLLAQMLRPILDAAGIDETKLLAKWRR